MLGVHPITNVTALVALLLIAGCRSTPTATEVPAQAWSGYGLLASRPRAERTADGLFVSGSVSRAASYSGSARMHLDVEVFSGDGQRLALVPTSFAPNPMPYIRGVPGHACYTQTVRGDFPPGVRVVRCREQYGNLQEY